MPTINGDFATSENLALQGPNTINGDVAVGENLVIYNGHVTINGDVCVGNVVVVSDVRDFTVNGDSVVTGATATIERYTPMLPPGSSLRRLP